MFSPYKTCQMKAFQATPPIITTRKYHSYCIFQHSLDFHPYLSLSQRRAPAIAMGSYCCLGLIQLPHSILRACRKQTQRLVSSITFPRKCPLRWMLKCRGFVLALVAQILKWETQGVYWGVFSGTPPLRECGRQVGAGGEVHL